ncbi:iron-containing alcohol dehydrogenase, partial [Azospirillum sp. TSO35-2]|uniref:iron-containing alcohol dehydrogenase n=1 Tax=Azospirillum sp. TSO35-2 TaxID=716796 RepID=UPI0011B7067C
YAEVARHLELGGSRDHERVEKLIGWVEELKRTLDIPTSIQAAGVPEAAFLAKLDELAEAAFDDQCTGANPRFPLVAEIKQLLLDSYYGRAYVEPSALDSAPAAAKPAARKEPALTK